MYYGRKVGYCFKWGEHHTALFPCKSLVFKPKEGNPWFLALSWRRKWQPTPVFLPGESRDGVAQSRTWLKWLSSKTVNLSQYQDNFYFSRVWLQIFECSLLGGHYGKIRHYPSNSSLEFMPVNIYIKKNDRFVTGVPAHFTQIEKQNSQWNIGSGRRYTFQLVWISNNMNYI